MTRDERVRYEMLLRVRDFGAAHADVYPASSAAGETFARIARAVADIDIHMVARLKAAETGRRSRAVARATVRRWMLAVARTVRELTRSRVESAGGLRMPKRESDAVLLAAARTFLDVAEPVRDDLIRLGLPATFVSEFRDAVAALELARADRRAGRDVVAASRAGITATLADAMSAARTLDVIVTNTLAADPVEFARWRRDRLVVGLRRRRSARRSVRPSSSDPAHPAVTQGDVST